MRNFVQLSSEERQYIYDHPDDYASDIADYIGCTPAAVAYWRKKQNVPTPPTKTSLFVDKYGDRWFSMTYEERMIALDEHGLSYWGTYQSLRRRGVVKPTTTKPCFSCGSEAADWLSHNCDHCLKGSKYNARLDSYTKGRCCYQKEIFKQMYGYGNEEIRMRTHALCQQWDCQMKREWKDRKRRKRTDKDKSLMLNFDGTDTD